MKEKLEAVLELPAHLKAGILVGSVALVVALYYFAIYSGVGEELAGLRGNIESMQREINEKKGIVAHLPRYEREVDRLDVELKKALTELPDKKSIEQLLARISDKARDAGLDIKLFQPMPEQLKDFYAEIPVEIKVSGTFHQVATFFDEVGHLSRIVNVNEFSIEEPKVDENQVFVNTSAVATSFRFLEESERPKKDEKKKRRRRGRSNDEA